MARRIAITSFAVLAFITAEFLPTFTVTPGVEILNAGRV